MTVERCSQFWLDSQGNFIWPETKMTRCQPLGDLCQMLQAEERATDPKGEVWGGCEWGMKEGMLGVCTARERMGGEVSDNK